MAALTFENHVVTSAKPRVDWGAIWAGVFTFAAIWSVFGLLGYAIFAGAANPNAARLGMGMSIGVSIWAIVLTIIAMYFAGRETGRLAMISNRHDAAVHGMIMFGLSVVAAFVIVVLGESGMTPTVAPVAHSALFSGASAGMGWAGFLSLFFGWLAAMGGASTGGEWRGAGRMTESEKAAQIRPAA